MCTPSHQLTALSVDEQSVPTALHFGNDLALFETNKFDFQYPRSFRVTDYIVIFLQQGSIRGRNNQQDTTYHAPVLLCIQPSRILEFKGTVGEIRAYCIAFSKRFTEQLNIITPTLLNTIEGKRRSIILNDFSQSIFLDYYERLKGIVLHADNPFRMEAALNLTRTFFYSVGYQYYQLQSREPNTRPQEIVKQFLSLIDKHAITEHRIEFYADKMQLSSKYLSSVIKAETNQTMNKWIEQTIVLQAKNLLLNTSLTIQQITDMLGFSDQSYFGAYFKRNTGMSPKQFRISGK